jgi:hypothetical protein
MRSDLTLSRELMIRVERLPQRRLSQSRRASSVPLPAVPRMGPKPKTSPPKLRIVRLNHSLNI